MKKFGRPPIYKTQEERDAAEKLSNARYRERYRQSLRDRGAIIRERIKNDPEKAQKKKEYHQKYFREHRLVYKNRHENWRRNNPEAQKAIEKRRQPKKVAHDRKRYHEDPKFREKSAEYQRNYKKRHPEVRRERDRLRRQTDIAYRIERGMRARLFTLVKRAGVRKKDRLSSLIGCRVNAMLKHLESQFRDGMSWENYGRKGWHIDHIMPCAAFDFTDQEQQKKCFHYSNLQPLWWWENMSKKDKIPQMKEAA